MTTYRITHRTTYRYETEVSTSYGEMRLLPRDLPTQRCSSTSMSISPAPHDLRQRVDYFGNRAGFFSVLTPHRELVVTATSVVDVQDRPTELALLADAPWESVRDRITSGEAGYAVTELALDSPLVAASPALLALAAPSFTPGRPLVDALTDLCHRIHDGFAFVPGSTTVSTSTAEVLTRRSGVCQDFAHVMIGCLRSVGLAGRYVSGYLETDPPPGRERLQGADVSHAWVSVWGGDAGWIDVDPTNDRFVGDRHITTAWARDYTDVPPLKGVIYTAGSGHELEVEVDVARQDS